MINNANRIQIAREALTASSKLRKRFGYDLSSPISMFDLCENSGVPVRFVDINMEGMYVHIGEGIKPTILISALRPFHRKIFTCAHEYGHHYFGHGLSVDQIATSSGGYNNEEFLADTMASYLLMPPLGLKGAFIKRKLVIERATALNCFIIACSFGIGYSTLINHLLFNSHIGPDRANQLLRQMPKSIKKSIIGEDTTATLFVIDEHFTNKIIDVETTSYLVLPNDVEVEDIKYLEMCKEVSVGKLYKILLPGITRIYSLSNEWSCFLRIQKIQYVGLSRYRHLSD